MKLKINFLNLWRLFFLPELHDDLHTMPVVLWWKIQKEQSAIHLIKGAKSTSKRVVNHCNNQWDKLNDYFTDYFGIQAMQKKYLKLLVKHQICVSKYARTKNHYWTTQRLIIEAELEDFKPSEIKDFNYYEELRNVSMTLDGANMNPQEMSVIQYYSDRNSAIKISKQRRQDANRQKAKK